MCIWMSAMWSKQHTWTDSRATEVRPIALCRVLTPEMWLQALDVAEKWWVRKVMYMCTVEMSRSGKWRWG